MRDIPIKNPGDQLFSAEWNDVAEELENIITSTGITLSASDLTQLSKAVTNYVAESSYYVDSGITNAYVVNPLGTLSPITSYKVGTWVRFSTTNPNTGPSTINVASLGVKPILDAYGKALTGGEIPATAEVQIFYDGTNFRLISSSLSSFAVGMTKKFVGCRLANNASDLLKDIDFNSGYFRANNRPLVFKSPTTIVKQLDAVWAPGSGVGGRASAVGISPNTWYHCFYLASNTGTIDAGFDASIIATNLLSDAAGYPYYAYRGSIKTDGSSNIYAFYNLGDLFYWNALVNEINGGLTGAYTNFTIGTPPGVITEAYLNGTVEEVTTGASEVLARSNIVPNFVRSILESDNGPANKYSKNDFVILADTASQIQLRYGAVNPTTFVLRTTGYRQLYDQ